MLNNVLLKTLRDKRRLMLFWGIGLVALAIIITTMLLPTITTAAEELESYFEIIPEELLAAFGGDLSHYLLGGAGCGYNNRKCRCQSA